MTGLALARRGAVAAAGKGVLPVTRIALGTGQRTTGSGGGPRTVSIPVTIPSGYSNLIAIIGSVTSHDGWYDYTNYGAWSFTHAADSATATREIAITGWAGGQPTGSAGLFSKTTNLTPGSHTFNGTFSTTGFNANSLMAQVAIYANVASISGKTSAQTGSNVAPSLNVTSGLNDMAVDCLGGDGTLGTFNQTILYSGGGAVSGIGDYMIMGEAIGEADNSVNFAAATARIHEHVALNLEAAA